MLITEADVNYQAYHKPAGLIVFLPLPWYFNGSQLSSAREEGRITFQTQMEQDLDVNEVGKEVKAVIQIQKCIYTQRCEALSTKLPTQVWKIT